MLISALSNATDRGGKTALVEYIERGKVHPHDLDARRRAVRLRRARERAASTACSPRRSRATRTTCASSPELMGDAAGDEELRQHDGRLGLPRAQAAPDAEGARRAARDPLGAGAAVTTTHSSTPRSPASCGRRCASRTAASRPCKVADVGDRAKRRRCSRSTSASRRTTGSCSSTPSWTARCACSTSRTRASRLVITSR